jgi:signal transduction histidine kinase
VSELAHLVADLVAPGDRKQRADKLAKFFGADQAILFAWDDEAKMMLPAQGFPQTLPKVASWRELVRQACNGGPVVGSVVPPGEEKEVCASAIGADDCVTAVFWPLENPHVLEPVRPYLVLLQGIFGSEAVQRTLQAQIAEAEGAAQKVSSLALQLDLARKHLETRVHERTAELRASIRELEGFTYSVAHDLRAPLRAIIMTSRILEDDFGEELSQEVKDLINIQADRARRLGKLIDDLLDLSRIARVELRRVNVDISAIAREIEQEIRDRLPEEGPQLTMDVEEDLVVRADPALVRLLVINLIENAFKYSPEGAHITVGRAGEAIFVRDRGIGFEQEYAQKIFRPFERLHTDEAFAGTGIGLANVQRIVERHGGRVWAEGAPGEGATFFFTLN